MSGEMVKFLEELKPSKGVECIDEVNFLLSLDSVWCLNSFKPSVCLVDQVKGEEGAAQLAVGKDRNFKVPIIQEVAKEESVLQGWVASPGEDMDMPRMQQRSMELEI